MSYPEQTPHPDTYKQMLHDRVMYTYICLQEVGQDIKIPLNDQLESTKDHMIALAIQRPELVKVDLIDGESSYHVLIPFPHSGDKKPPQPIPTDLWTQNENPSHWYWEEKLTPYIKETNLIVFEQRTEKVKYRT